jgi:hypothetical protein
MLRSTRSRFLVLSAALAVWLLLLLWGGPGHHSGPASPALAAPAVEIRPARVKPGDPEIRIPAAPDVVAVRVKLPFETEPRLAVLDEDSGTWAVRFLVPSDVPDGTYQARVLLTHADGSTEERQASIHVDTHPAPIAVVAAPARVEPGRTLALRLEPALPLATLASAIAGPGKLAETLRGATDVKDILVRAPWGEVAKARQQGMLGSWTVELHVPPWAALGAARLEIVGMDAAGNVSRRSQEVEIGPSPLPAWIGATAGGLLAALVGGMTLVLRPRARSDGA